MIRFYSKMRPGLLFLLLAFAFRLSAQSLHTVSTKWGDSFAEWEIYAVALPDSTDEDSTEMAMPEETLFGTLKLRWLNVRDDWSEWDFDLDGERGTIRMKWKDDPTQWELRTYSGAVVTMRTAWPNDKTQWRITDNQVTLLLKSRWTNQLDEWLVDDASHGKFYLYTLQRQDPRDWAVEDDLGSEVSMPMRLALIFVTLFQSTPKT